MSDLGPNISSPELLGQYCQSVLEITQAAIESDDPLRLQKAQTELLGFLVAMVAQNAFQANATNVALYELVKLLRDWRKEQSNV